MLRKFINSMKNDCGKDLQDFVAGAFITIIGIILFIIVLLAISAIGENYLSLQLPFFYYEK